MVNQCLGNEMIIKPSLTQRQIEIVRQIKFRNKREKIMLDRLACCEVLAEDIDELVNMLGAEFMRHGLLPSWEPNKYGLEVEGILDIVNRPRVEGWA